MRIVAFCVRVLGVIVLARGLQSRALPQDLQGDDVRGAFLTTRPKTAEKPSSTPTGKPSRRPPRRVTPKPTATPTPDSGEGKTVDKGRAANQRLGLGFTLFMRDSN